MTGNPEARNGGTKRVKTGCITCRVRRVKCDEKKPQCVRCVSTGRKCEGYTPVPASRRELITALREQGNPRDSSSPSLSPVPRASGFLSSSEASQFDFFRTRTSPSTNAFLGSDFWSRSVLQLAHVEPSIKHAVLALSALHRRVHMIDLSSPEAEGWKRQAFIQYGNSVNATQRLLQRTQKSDNSSDKTAVLAACVVLSCFDNLSGNYEGARMHLHSGLRLAAERNKHPRHILPSMDTTDREVTDLLARLDLQAMTFSDSKAPYDPEAPTITADTPLPITLTDFSEARAHLVNIMRTLLRLGFVQDNEYALFTGPYVHHEHTRCASRLKEWQNLFENFLRVTEPQLEKPTQGSNLIVGLLRVYHTIASIVLRAGYTGPETRWDCLYGDFKKVIEYCEPTIHCGAGLPCSTDYQMEQGPMMPLFLVATRCRDPVLRRRAVELIESTERVEGCWESRGAAAVARRIMNVEEGSLGPDVSITCAADVVEAARVHTSVVMVDVEKRRVDMRLMKNTSGGQGEWFSVEESVFF